MSNKENWFNFRIDPDLRNFIRFLKKNNFNVGGYLRDQLRELEKKYTDPDAIKKQIDELQDRLQEANNGNGVLIKDKKVRDGFEVLNAIAMKRGYTKSIGMEDKAVPSIINKLGVTEQKARDILKTLSKLDLITSENKQIIVVQKELKDV